MKFSATSEMKGAFAVIMRERIVWKNRRTVKCWSINSGNYNATVTTIIIEKYFLFLKRYVIKQYVPLLPSPTYDGEYCTNKMLKAAAIEEQGFAEIALLELKSNNKNI